ncbi:MAG: hypothetical protein GXO54_05395 [Chloroflexi bacterium]|nr:hypothetical protein [Chloroflexota bacterium]
MPVDPQVVRETILAESVLIDKQGILGLYEAVRKMMGFGLGGLLYRAGKTAGHRSADLLAQRLNVQGEDLLTALTIAFNTARWGQAELQRTNGDTWTLVVRDSVLGANMESKKPVCHPIAGYWAGFLERALGRSVDVREVECMATGAPACRFEVRLK